MFYFKQGLLETLDFLVVLLLEIKHHRDCGASITLLKLARVRAHVESHVADFVRLVMAVARHDNCTFEFIDHSLLNFSIFGLLVGKALAFSVETFNLLVNELETVVDGKILRNVVDDKVETPLEDP